LYVGGIAPHKNLIALVDAVAALRRADRFADLRLLIVGDYTGDVFYSAYPEVRRHIDVANIGGMISPAGLPIRWSPGLMRLAKALVLPSLDEGFGLPAIEAARLRRSRLVTQHSAMPETLGTPPFYFDPEEVGGLERELERLLRDESLRGAWDEGRRTCAHSIRGPPLHERSCGLR